MSAPRPTLLLLPVSSMLGYLLPLLFPLPTAGRPHAHLDFTIARRSPEEESSLPTSAGRSLKLVWREIVVIVGVYCFLTSVFLGCLLTVGRRLRRSAQQSNQTLEMVMMKPRPQADGMSLQIPQTPQPTWPSPLSATETVEWQSPQKGKPRSFSLPWSRGQTPISRAESVSTVDENVVRADRLKAQEEMERLYAAVMEHDAQLAEARSNGQCSPKSPRQPRSPLEGPPEFRHLRQRQQSLQSLSPVSPMSPLSRELPSPVYPEHYLPPMPQPQHQPQQHLQLRLPEASQVIYQEPPEAHQEPISPRSNKPSRLSALSFLSSKSRKARRESVRHLPISPPILSPEITTPVISETPPLSPRIYQPGPPPLNPVQQQQRQQYKGKYPQSTISRNVSVDTTYSVPPPLHLRSAGSSTSTLPFRAAFDSGPMSAPPTKTTIVERRESLLGPMGPRTGIPRTPYSPYMPFTPITPLTPSRMITRDERKQIQKKNGTRVQTQEDLVMSDEEMWS